MEVENLALKRPRGKPAADSKTKAQVNSKVSTRKKTKTNSDTKSDTYVIPSPVVPPSGKLVASSSTVEQQNISLPSTSSRMITLSEQELENLIKRKVTESQFQPAASSACQTQTGSSASLEQQHTGVAISLQNNAHDAHVTTNQTPWMTQLPLPQHSNQLMFSALQLVMQQQQHEIERLYESNSLRRAQQSNNTGLQMLNLIASGMKPMP